MKKQDTITPPRVMARISLDYITTYLPAMLPMFDCGWDPSNIAANECMTFSTDLLADMATIRKMVVSNITIVTPASADCGPAFTNMHLEVSDNVTGKPGNLVMTVAVRNEFFTAHPNATGADILKRLQMLMHNVDPGLVTRYHFTGCLRDEGTHNLEEFLLSVDAVVKGTPVTAEGLDEPDQLTRLTAFIQPEIDAAAGDASKLADLAEMLSDAASRVVDMADAANRPVHMPYNKDLSRDAHI